MNKDFFVLMEVGWDYNDEVMFQPESGGGYPRKIFEDEEAANKACVAANIAQFKRLVSDGEIRNYFYGLDEIIPYRDRNDMALRATRNAVSKKLFEIDFNELADFVNNNDTFPVAVEGSTDEDWKAFMDVTSLNFWEVVPVEKG